MRLRKRRTETAFELEQIIVVKRRQGSVASWCSACELEVVMLTPDEAASITSATARALYRLVDAGNVHFTETQSGLIRVCLPSLLQAIGAEKQQLKQLSPYTLVHRELSPKSEAKDEDEEKS